MIHDKQKLLYKEINIQIQNYIYIYIYIYIYMYKSRLKSGSACYHSVQDLQSSSLLSKNTKIKIYRTMILPLVLYECVTWFLTLGQEHKLRVFENMAIIRE
jgi:hypothetical protein